MSLAIHSTNFENLDTVLDPLQFYTGSTTSSVKTRRMLQTKTFSEPVISVEAFAWLELSMVPEVERVCVEHDENNNEYRIVTIVNQRDSAVRAKIYEREKAIIDAKPGLFFDFHVAARMNRNLDEIVYGVGKRSFER